MKSDSLIVCNICLNPGCVLKVVEMLSIVKYLKLHISKLEKMGRAVIAFSIFENDLIPVIFKCSLFFPKKVYV